MGIKSIVINIEVKKINKNWEVFITNGRDRTGLEVNDWIKKCQDLGAGEIMVTSIDNEGTGKGPDLNLVKSIQNTAKLPVIYSGGIGILNDIKDLCKYKIDALALSRVLHYNLHSITEIKRSINSIS